MLWRDETMETRQDNDEKQQVRALLCVLDKVWGLKLFCCAGDVTAMLLLPSTTPVLGDIGRRWPTVIETANRISSRLFPSGQIVYPVELRFLFCRHLGLRPCNNLLRPCNDLVSS